MARNGRHALLVLIFLFGVSHAGAFFCAAAGPFRRISNTALALVNRGYSAAAKSTSTSTSTTCFEGRGVSGVSDASSRFEGVQGALPPHFQSADSVAWVQLVLDSFEEAFDGQALMPWLDRESLSPQEQARQVAVAEEALISHDFLRNADDPIFIYGNEAGLRTFGYTWEEFTTLPSRKSCEEGDLREQRAEMLQDVRESDKTTPVVGVRVTKTGERFKISAVLWNVKDAGGRTVGQSARLTVLD